ncbi:HEPN domain-containing protein [Streptomyces sp. BH055]|uniref:HEPN domain-containing protein n=1 Tax=Streptomyces sp. BH055 TaxID=3401173 RepID=UPI003BB62B53
MQTTHRLAVRVLDGVRHESPPPRTGNAAASAPVLANSCDTSPWQIELALETDQDTEEESPVASKAREQMATALDDVETLANAGRGIPNGPAVRSALVLLCTALEAYVEDVTVEAVESIVALPSVTPDRLPKPLHHWIAERVKTKNPWDLAGGGWKSYTVECVQSRVDSLNTPDSKNVNELLERTLGLKNALGQVSWQKMSSSEIAERLDLLITIRGNAVHRGETPGDLNIGGVFWWHNWSTRLADKLDALISDHLRDQYGLTLAADG